MSFSRAGVRRRTRLAATGTAAVLFLGFTAHAAVADTDDQKKKADADVRQTQRNLDDTSADLIKANKALAATDANVKTAQARLKTANTKLTSARNHYRDMQSQLTIAKADETKNAGQLRTNAAQQAKSKQMVGGIARQSYMSGGLGSLGLTLDILSSRGDVTSQLSVADVVMRQQNSALTKLSGQQAAGTAAGSRLTATRQRVATLTVKASNAQTAATTAQTNATTARNALVALQKKQTTERNTLTKRKAQETKQLKSQQAEADRLEKLIRKRNLAAAKAAKRAASTATRKATAPSGSTSSGGGVLAAPDPISSIRSGFGSRVNPVLGVRLMHEGDDFPYACGTPVHAAAAGTVVSTGYDSAGGNHVLIDHGYLKGTNLATYYAHFQSAAVVHAGQKVSKGQLIGYSGTTGRSTGCHLHFGVMANGVFVNPIPWIS